MRNKGQKCGIEIVGFMRFVSPCLDDSDDIRDLQWRIYILLIWRKLLTAARENC